MGEKKLLRFSDGVEGRAWAEHSAWSHPPPTPQISASGLLVNVALEILIEKPMHYRQYIVLKTVDVMNAEQ